MEREKKNWPLSDGSELVKIKEVLESNSWWRGSGTKVKEFEKKFADYHNVSYALGVSNGTHALEVALKVFDIGMGDEVIVPAFTFIATATAVLNCNATPVFCDVDADTFCMDPQSFKEAITCNTKAVIPVHMAGNLCDMEQISRIAKERDIKVIEDAAHAQGGEWNNKKIGYYSDIATFSFQNRKVMTCGEGGAIITNSKRLYEKLYLLHSVGRPEGDIIYKHLVLGSNDRMSEFHAAILLCQLEKLQYYNSIREKNVLKLNEFLADIKGIIPQKSSEKCTANTHYMYMFYYDKEAFGNMSKEVFIEQMNNSGVSCYVPYPLVFQADFFENEVKKGDSRFLGDFEERHYPNALKIVKEVVWIPHYELLCRESELYKIREIILDIQKRANSERNVL